MWQRWLSCLVLLCLVSCGGGSLTGTSPLPPAARNDIQIQSEGNDLVVQVKFPSVASPTARITAGDPLPSSSIPFGTDRIVVTATSTTEGIPYQQELILTLPVAVGRLRAVPRLAALSIDVNAFQSATKLAGASVSIPPIVSAPVLISLVPESFVPVLNGVSPNPAQVGSTLTLQGFFPSGTVIRFASAGPGSLTNPVINGTVVVPLGAISGPIVALNANGVGVGAIPLIIGTFTPLPSPSFSPSPLPSPSPPPGIVFTVNSNSDLIDSSPGDGVCQTTLGTCTLRAAIQEANSFPDLQGIIFDTSLTSPINLSLVGSNEDLAATGDLDVTDDLVIIGNVGAGLTIDGQGLDRIFDIKNGKTLSLSYLTLQNGMSDLGGAILVNNLSSLGINNSIIQANIAAASPFATGNGGGIAAIAAGIAISDSSFLTNDGEAGGAIWSSNSVVILLNTVVETNQASLGAGIYQEGGNLDLQNSTVQNNGNSSTTTGGGIFTTGSVQANVMNTTIDGNSAQKGGGFAADLGAQITVDSSTLSNNTASIGGGIYADGADLAGIPGAAGTQITLNSGSSLTSNVATDTSTANPGGGVYLLNGATFLPIGVPVSGNGTFGGVTFTGNTPTNIFQ